MLVLHGRSVFAQLPPYYMSPRSWPDLFTFYEDNNANMPAGSDLVSKSVIFIHGINPDLPNPDGDASSTAFVIRTFRDDDLVCVCMTGHQAKIFNGRQTPTVPSDIEIKNQISMNYKARDVVSATDGEHRVGPHEAVTSYLDEMQLVAYFGDPINLGTGNDAALFLVDKRKLPLASFGALGYGFRVVSPSATQKYFTIGHPWGYPQRLSDSLFYDDDDNNWMDFSTRKPYCVGRGSSGSPLIRSGSVMVDGILSTSVNGVEIDDVSIDGRLRGYLYSTDVRFTRMAILAPAIKQHCWKNVSEAQMTTSLVYTQSVEVSNPAASLRNTNQSITSATGISGSSAAFTETALNGKKITRLTANNCTFGSFALPVAYPGTTATPWRVVVSANQVDVNAGFSYAASGISEMDLTTIETYTRSATSRLADAAADTASNSSDGNSGVVSGFKLFPNPSPDGIFFLELPAAEKDVVYTGSIMSADGKLVQELNHMQGGTKTSFNLSQQPRGMYLLSVYAPGGVKVFTMKITLQ
ncbi:hypothetical protein GCM10023092_27020 [Rurimicrobium arvi]|uniref:Secretion system C-terminal sorting domain-containing protein n=2 Tax=Rurimicrobium arvi TaxID=2049916 RepID=A0ABP8N0U5_9BACT